MEQVEKGEQQHARAAVSTEITDTDCMQMECQFNNEKVIELTADIMVLQQKLSVMSSVLGRIGKDNRQVHFYTGLPSYDVFKVLFHHLSPLVSKATRSGSGLSLADKFLLVLMKLTRATTNQDLVYRFNILCCKISNIFHQWIDVMAANLKPFICWPEKDAIMSNMSDCFKPQYSKAVCIIDCSKIFIQCPSSLKARAKTYSNYKHHNTVKFCLATTSTGAISFVSKCWGGRVSDKHLTVSSGLL